MIEEVKKKAHEWLGNEFDVETRKEVQNLLDNDEKKLIDAFYKELEFGTGGLRGIMGAGTNRMNVYTIGMATQGLANYLKKNFGSLDQIKVAIAYDCRNNSRLFAETCAQIFSANAIKVYLFDSLRPTPELSFAIRELGCQSGVVITASHNPKEYNGFKAYWEDGAQLISPHDENVVGEVRKIKSVSEVLFQGNSDLIEVLDYTFDEKYLEALKTVSLSPEVIEKHKDMPIVYTPIHGTGVDLAPAVLRKFGFTNIVNVPEQDVIDGNFPTVISPNPENADALKMALDKAEAVDAELVMASDPDADRVGIAVRNDKEKFILLNGNQTGALLFYYMIEQWKATGKLKGKEYLVKTIVTSDLMKDMADKYNIEIYDVLTGFKYIAAIMLENEGKKSFIVGGEESYGYLAGEFVRDKDAIMACALIAETAAWAKEQGKSMYELLQDIYVEFGFYKETLVNLVKKGKEGAEAIQQMMTDFRVYPPEKLGNSKVIKIYDYQKQEQINLQENKTYKIDLPKSNVLQFITEDGSKISVRPSGTEPKIKFYISVNDKLESKANFLTVENNLNTRISEITADLGVS